MRLFQRFVPPAFVGVILAACSSHTSGSQTTEGGLCAPSTSADPCGQTGECTSLPPTCPTSCTPLGTVRFHLTVPASSDAGDSYSATTYDWAADPASWFTVSTAAGAALQIVPPTSDAGPALYWAPSCSVCAPLAIVPLATQATIQNGEISGTWTGTSYSLTATCNQAQNGVVPCGDLLCAAAGHYSVTMCAIPPRTNGAPECVSVPFDFPGTSDVTGKLGG